MENLQVRRRRLPPEGEEVVTEAEMQMRTTNTRRLGITN